MSKKLWLFGTYAWQGNPKALFLYMNKYCIQTHECWWVADNEKDAEAIKAITGIKNITSLKSKNAGMLFSRCDVYVTENFRENYPLELSEHAKIFNTWHGVGLKHIELALVKLGMGLNYSFIDSVMRKNIKNLPLYRNQSFLLVTSKKMEEHFIADTTVHEQNIIRGVYPRNFVYANNPELNSYYINDILPKQKSEYGNIIFFAPTHRFGSVGGVLNFLIPDFELLEHTLRETNQLLIIKVHPLMKNDNYYTEMLEKYKHSKNIVFWNDGYDIYEVFSQIDIAIVDYSSIFYDLLDAGVTRFVRYIPDFEQYQQDLELIGDYMDLTAGMVVENYQSLLDVLSNHVRPISENKKDYLKDYFFGYADGNQHLGEMIELVDNTPLAQTNLKELHSFDVFDTLIGRSTLKPLGIFEYVRDIAKKSNIEFPRFLIEDWVDIRNKVEHDVRDMMRKTTFERKSNTLEITFDDIYNRLQENMRLSDEQINFLKKAEIEAEVYHAEPIQKRIDFLFSMKEQGHDVVLVSDMYLPEETIRAMLIKADSRLADIPLYVSGSIGYQKSTGKLYQYIFSDRKYCYQRWVHYGDNKHADGAVARKLGIQTVVHDIDDFIPFESELIKAMDNYNRYPAYQLATKMQKYRKSLLPMMDNTLLEQKYYAYAYVGSAFVPYVNWLIKDAISRNYEKIYFVSRDGYFLKQIADLIIQTKNYSIKTDYIYGSRKAWRLPSYINHLDAEFFGNFGNFVSMDGFDDLVKASYLSQDELLSLFPEFEYLKNKKHLRGEVSENVRKIIEGSEEYHRRILELAQQKRLIVKQYIQQTIDPSQKFAFVEFWGRGYTQDLFGRLLNNAFNQEIQNPYYYVRSFTNNKDNSIRHNFISTAQNFSFFEPIFAQTPYESIVDYSDDGKKIIPIIIPKDSHLSDIISEGLLKFTEDYLSLNVQDHDYFNYALAKFSYQYQITAYNDQFIGRVFSEYTYNESSYSVDKKYAPALTLKQLQNISSKHELEQLTRSIPISLAKSSDKVVAYYKKIQANYKLPVFNGVPINLVYAAVALDKYVYSNSIPFSVITLQDCPLYMDVSFSEASQNKNISLKKFNKVDVIAIDWLKNGVPRLLTPYGYITANKEWVQKFDDVCDNFVENEDGGYNWQPSFAMGALIKATNIINTGKAESNKVPPPNTTPKPPPKPKPKPTQPTQIKESINQSSDFERKLHKFSRNPHGFFKDVKDKRVAKMQILFDEKHMVGRTMSRWVRKKFNT